MRDLLWVNPALGLNLLTIGIFHLAMGLRGLTTRKPFVMYGRQHLWLILFCLVQIVIFQMILSFFPQATLPRYDSILLILRLYTVILGVTIVVFWILFRGYLIYGVTKGSFREALANTLTKLNIPFQETIPRLRLTEINADLHTDFSSFTGTAQLRFKPEHHKLLLKQIGDGLREYFQSTAVQINLTFPILQTILGFILLLAAILYGFGLPILFNAL